MKVNKSNIESLRRLINLINSQLENKESLSEFDAKILYSYVSEENLLELLDVLSSVKKTNINKIIRHVNLREKNKNESKIKNSIEINYDLETTLKIFNELSDDEISDKYRLVQLKAMYLSLFSENPAKSKNKTDIIKVIRNYIYTCNRAKAFRI